MQRIDPTSLATVWATQPDPDPHRCDEPPACAECGGFGWVGIDVPVTHPDFGRMLRCACRSDDQTQRRLAVSELGMYAEMTFETFRCVKGTKIAFSAAQQFAQQPTGWLLLIGDFGSGKTHLAAAVAREAAIAGHDVLFRPVPDLLDELRAGYDDPTVSFMQRMERLKRVAVLILDDYGAASETPWTRDKLFQLINSRYVEKRPTIITTNLTLAAIREQHGRIGSRLGDRALVRQVVLQADDYRARVPGAA